MQPVIRSLATLGVWVSLGLATASALADEPGPPLPPAGSAAPPVGSTAPAASAGPAGSSAPTSAPPQWTPPASWSQTPSWAQTPPDKARGGASAARADPTFRWSYHFTYEVANHSTKGFKHDHRWAANGFEIERVAIDGFRMFRVTPALYFGAGATLGYAVTQSSDCFGEPSCPADVPAVKWQTRGFTYGGMVGLSVGGMTNDLKAGALLWLPILRVSHVVTSMFREPSRCDPSGPHPCDGWSAGNVILDAAFGGDFIYHGTAGCGFRLGIGYLLGDLAEAQNAGILYSIAFAINVEALEKRP